MAYLSPPLLRGKHAASLEVTAGKEKEIASHGAMLKFVTTALHYRGSLGVISSMIVAPLACNTTHARK